MRSVYLYGSLAEEFGPVFKLRGNTIGAIIRLLEANYPGKFMRSILHGEYQVVAGKSLEDEKGIHFDNDLVRKGLALGSKDLHIVPSAEGSGGGGFFRVVLGAVIVAAAVVASGGTAAGFAGTAFSVGTLNVSFGSVALFGASLALGGIAQLLTPVPKISAGDYNNRNSPEERASYIFNGAVNTTEQGGPVPLVYGRMVIGSTVISGGITAEQI